MVFMISIEMLLKEGGRISDELAIPYIEKIKMLL